MVGIERCGFSSAAFLSSLVGQQLRFVHSSPIEEKGMEDSLRFVGRISKRGENKVVGRHRVHSTFVQAAGVSFPGIALAGKPGSRLEGLQGLNKHELQSVVLPLLKKGAETKCVFDDAGYVPHLKGIVPKLRAGAYPTCTRENHSHQVALEHCLIRWGQSGHRYVQLPWLGCCRDEMPNCTCCVRFTLVGVLSRRDANFHKTCREKMPCCIHGVQLSGRGLARSALNM